MSTVTAAQTQKSIRVTGLPAFAIALGMVLSVLIAAGIWKDVRKRPGKNNGTSSRDKDIITIVHASYEVN